MDEPTELDQIIDTWFYQEFASWMTHPRGQGAWGELKHKLEGLKQRLRGRSIEQPVADGALPAYVVLYVDAMQETVRRLGPSLNEPKPEIFETFIAVCEERRLPMSGNIASAITTLLRPPGRWKGGLQRS